MVVSQSRDDGGTPECCPGALKFRGGKKGSKADGRKNGAHLLLFAPGIKIDGYGSLSTWSP